MIKIVNLRKKYKRKKVFDELSLQFPAKGIVSIIGRSGSGKSTLLNILAGLDKPNKGRIILGEQTIKRYRDRRWSRLRRDKIGIVYQHYNLFRDKTVAENISFVLKNMVGCPKDLEEIKRIIHNSLEKVGLGGYEMRIINELSGGQQQRVAIARAIATDPKYYFADEPTGNLDEYSTIKIMNTLSQLAEEKLVVLVTHDLKNCVRYSDYIYDLTKKTLTINDEKETDQITSEEMVYLSSLKKIDHLHGIRVFTDGSLPLKDLEITLYDNSLYLDSNHTNNMVIYDSLGVVKIQDEVQLLEKNVLEKTDYDLKKYRLKDYVKSKTSFLFQMTFIIMGLIFAFFSLLVISKGVPMASVMKTSRSLYRHHIYDTRALENVIDVIGVNGVFFEDHVNTGTYIEHAGKKIVVKNSKILDSLIAKKPIHLLKGQDILIGSIPSSLNGIVVSLEFFNHNKVEFRAIGINHYRDLMGVIIHLYDKEFVIQGITNEKTIHIYVDNDFYNAHYSHEKSYNIINHRLMTKMEKTVTSPKDGHVLISSALAIKNNLKVGETFQVYEEKAIIQEIFPEGNQTIVFNERDYLSFRFNNLYLRSIMIYTEEGKTFGTSLYFEALAQQNAQYAENEMIFIIIAGVLLLTILTLFVVLKMVVNKRNTATIATVRSLGITRRKVVRTYFRDELLRTIFFLLIGLLLGAGLFSIFCLNLGEEVFIGISYVRMGLVVLFWLLFLTLITYRFTKKMVKRRPAQMMKKGSAL